MTKNLFNKIVLYSVICFLLLLAPSAINTPSQTAIRAICTGLAVDKTDDGQKIEVSAQVLIPEAGGQYTQKLSIITHDGKNLEDALNSMEFQVGKKIRFAHCCYIIVGSKIAEDNLVHVLDYLMRGNNIGNNTLLVHTDKKAKDLLGLTSNINSNEVDNLQIITKYNEKYLFSNGANMKSFFADYLSPHKTSFMANITIQEEPSDSGSSNGSESSKSEGGGGQSSGGSNGAESSGGSGSDSASKNTVSDKVTSDGTVAVFYKGKCAYVLESKERECFNWLDPYVYNTMFQIEGITDKELVDATIGFTITQKKMKWKFEIVNNTPTIRINYDLGLEPEMIIQGDDSSLPEYNDYISDAVKLAVTNYVNNAVQSAMKIQKQYGFDVFNFYKSFNINCHNDWQNYLKTLDNPEDYIKNIEVFVDLNCYNAI